MDLSNANGTAVYRARRPRAEPLDRRGLHAELETHMSDQPPEPEPPPEEPYQLPGTEPAWEPATLPNRGLTAADAAAFLPKDIG